MQGGLEKELVCMATILSTVKYKLCVPLILSCVIYNDHNVVSDKQFLHLFRKTLKHTSSRTYRRVGSHLECEPAVFLGTGGHNSFSYITYLPLK